VCFPLTAFAEPRLDRNGDPLPDGAIARFGTTRFRFPNFGHVAAACISPDGKLLAVEISSCVIRVMDLKDGRCVLDDLGPCPASDGQQTLSFSSNNNYLVRAGDRIVSAYDVRTGKQQMEFDAGSPHCSVAFLPDSTQFAVIHGGTTVYVFDVEKRCKEPDQVIDSSAYSLGHSGKYYVGVHSLLDAKSGKVLREFTVKSVDETPRFALSPNDRWACFAHSNGRLHVFDVATGKSHDEVEPVSEWEADFATAQLCFSSDSAIAYVSQGTGIYFRRDLRAKKWLEPLKTSGGKMIPHPDGKRLLHMDHFNVVRQIDAKTQKEMPSPGPVGFRSAPTVAVSPDGRNVAISSDGRLDLFEPEGRLLWTTPLQGSFGKPRWSADGKRISCAGGREATICDARTGKILQVFASPDADLEFTGLVGFDSASDRLIACLNHGEAVSFFDLKSGKATALLQPGIRGATDISPDVKTLAFENGSPSVALFDLTTERFRIGFMFPPPPRRGCGGGGIGRDQPSRSFTPDGAHYLSWHVNGEALLWDTASGQPVGCIQTKIEDHSCFAFSSDGLWLAVGTYGGYVSVWDISNGEMVVGWAAHSSSIESLEFAGLQRLLTTSDDLTGLVWDMKPRKKPLQPAWDALNGDDALEAYRAVWALTDDPKGPELLRSRIAPVKMASAVQVKQWITELAAEKFAIRETATKGLQTLGRLIEPELRTARAQAPGEETGTRLDALLAKIPRERSAQEVIHARAVAALELSPSDAAKKLLAEWAAGAPGARLTLDAKAALTRLNTPSR